MSLFVKSTHPTSICTRQTVVSDLTRESIKSNSANTHWPKKAECKVYSVFSIIKEVWIYTLDLLRIDLEERSFCYAQWFLEAVCAYISFILCSHLKIVKDSRDH